MKIEVPKMNTVKTTKRIEFANSVVSTELLKSYIMLLNP